MLKTRSKLDKQQKHHGSKQSHLLEKKTAPNT
jgi:hypothetical protein